MKTNQYSETTKKQWSKPQLKTLDASNTHEGYGSITDGGFGFQS